jgi:hypothetical protein
MKNIYPIASMIPWVCSYRKDDKKFGIILWADDPDQILEDWCDRLQDLEIEGYLIGEEDA